MHMQSISAIAGCIAYIAISSLLTCRRFLAALSLLTPMESMPDVWRTTRRQAAAPLLENIL